jgi:hypothetical protein
MSDKIDKQQIYNQIDEFNNTPSNPDDTSSKTVAKSYLYVDNSIALNRAKFVKYIFDEQNITIPKNTIDLTYGSGSLTTHIMLENDLDTNKLILNDKNIANVNNDIEIGNITHSDILDKSKFNKKYDLIVFNPQIGGNYPDGKLDIEDIVPIISKTDIKNYISLKDVKIKVNEDKKEIFIHSDKYSQKEMNDNLKHIKIFNYYDILYQSKQSNIQGQNTNIIKFRNTLDKISTTNTIIIFYGKEEHYNRLLKDYNYKRYITDDDGADLFIASKIFDEIECFECEDGTFYENENCKKETINHIDDTTTIQELNTNLEDIVKKMSNLGSIWGKDDNTLEDDNDNDDEAVTKISQSQNQQEKKKQKPFKNFLKDMIVKEDKQ